MIITKASPKRKGLTALYIDGEYALDVDTETLLSSRFTVGSELDDDELLELVEASGEKRAKERALWLISYRDHSRRELLDKLKKTSGERHSERAVERMEELGLVDDRKYAERYARELINVKHLSVRAAMYKLSQKGIDRELSESILEELDPDPREHIAAVIEKKYRNSLSDEKARRRAVAALQRMGYGWSDISAVLEEYESD